MDTTSNDTLTKCLFRYSSRGKNRISILTRSRGMLRGSTGLCYDSGSVDSSEFLSLTSKPPLHRSFQDLSTMFVLTDDVTSPSYHTTCFGQDVAAYSEIVTIMVKNKYFCCLDGLMYHKM